MNNYLSKRGDLQLKLKPGTINSFVSPGAKFELGIGIMCLGSEGATSISRYGCCATENVSN